MRILTKLKCRFRTLDKVDRQAFVSKGNNLIEDAPDWIEKDPLFPLVVADGTLIKLDNQPIVSAAEADPDKIIAAPKPAPKKTAPKKTAAKKK